jgi:hypothetical protein
MKVCTLDIESNRLLADSLNYNQLPYKLNNEARLWLVVVRDLDTGEVFLQRNENITKEWLKSVLSNYDVIVGHNIQKFDAPMLSLFGVLDYKIGYLGELDIVFGREVRIIDTLVMSRLLWPDRGGHSLHWWGEKLGKNKIDFRQICIDNNYIDAKDPKGAEFNQYVPEMDEYCIGDNEVTALIYKELWPQIEKYRGWQQALQQELILADYGVKREIFGFWFDKELALKCVEDLQQKIQHCYDKVTPLLPPKPLNKGELAAVTPPKIQLKKDGTPSNNMVKFALKHNAEITSKEDKWVLLYKGRTITIPFEEPLETEGKADISDLDHVKMHLLNLGWVPSEFKERDLTKDSKKQNNPYVKRIASLRKYIEETLAGKYRKERLEILDIPEESLYEVLSEKLKDDRPVRVPISPVIRPGLEKELDPNLVKLGEKVEFAKDFADYLTYRHRLNSIASGSATGGDGWSPEESSSGFLHMYNEINGRIQTPAIECATNTNRYRHIGVCNICRVTSTYGKEMRSLFGVPKGKVFFNFDYSSLEQRCSAHYIYKYPNGIEQGKSYLAEKPNDSHTKLSKILGIPRSEAKSVSYACLPMDTQILTFEGWKSFDDVNVGDTLPTFNSDKNIVEADSIKLKHFFDDKEVWEYSNAQHNIRATLDHRWYGWVRHTPKKKPRYKEYGWFTMGDIKSEYNIQTAAPYVGGNSKITEDEASLMGWILSEGYTKWSKKEEVTSASKGKRKEFICRIAQSKNYFYKDIEDLLSRLRMSYKKYESKRENGNHVYIYSIQGDSIRPYWDKVVGKRMDKHDVNWVKWVLSLTNESRNSFLEAFYKGDGHTEARLNRNQYIITQNKGNICDGVLVAMQMSGDGKCTTKVKEGNCMILMKSPRPHITTQTMSKKSLGVQDTFCLTTGNGSFIIKQGSLISITGNCQYGAQPKKLSKMLNGSINRAKEIYDGFWETNSALSSLKQNLEKFWEKTGKRYVVAIDGRKLIIRSQHALINTIYQSMGVIYAKYVTIFIREILEKKGYNMNPFVKSDKNILGIIEMHDEAGYEIDPSMLTIKTFNNEEEAEEFVKNWNGGQLSAIGHGKKPYICLPNDLSEAILEAMDRTDKLLKINVPMGMEWQIGRNWAQTH